MLTTPREPQAGGERDASVLLEVCTGERRHGLRPRVRRSSGTNPPLQEPGTQYYGLGDDDSVPEAQCERGPTPIFEVRLQGRVQRHTRGAHR